MLTLLDWGIIGAYLVVSLLIGLYFAKRAGKNLESFFLGGRNLPGWLAGLSMVATTFATDTPLYVADVVRRQGIAGNWFWWSMLFGAMLTTFFFAKLWRRSGVMTDLEFITLRYHGAPARWLRGLRAVYLGVFLNGIVIAWVNVALRDILIVIFPSLSENEALALVAGCMLLTVAYSSLSGLLGVVVTDAVQFALAMGGCIMLAYWVVDSPQIGGLDGLVAQVNPETLNLLPSLGSADGGTLGNLTLGIGTFLTMIALQWWGSWFPGAEPGGGGYVAQRIMATKNERQALLSTFFFNIFHYALRPWPWIIVGLAAIVLYPNLNPDDGGKGFVMVMKDFLPPGLLGLMLAAFLAAYMSTISSQLNWGVSYLISDLYQPYLAPGKTEKHYVNAARVSTVLLMVISLGITSILGSISEAWEFLVTAGAGLGLVLILRWYWWRVNAWSEITAMLIPLILLPFVMHFVPNQGFFGERTHFVILTVITTIGWLVVTFLTPPEPDAHLRAFASRVHPRGIWNPFKSVIIHDASEAPLWVLTIAWLAGCALVYGLLLGTGGLLLGQSDNLIGGISATLISTCILAYLSRKWRLL